jgi:membrane-bound serine protease (ClpP class)
MMRWKQAAGGIVAFAAMVAIGAAAEPVMAQTAQPVAAARPGSAAQRAHFVAEISLDGPIGPAAAEYFEDAAKRAVSEGASAIILRLDTPGGLSESMRRIVSSVLASRVPVLCYVAPGGARAASAGTYILYACQIAAMAPATHLGAATPVALGRPTPMPAPSGRDAAKPALPGVAADTIADSATDSATDAATGAAQEKAAPAPRQRGDAESNKVLNDAVAYIRSLAQLRGRNAEWAEQAVRGAATLTASEAAERHVIDFVALDAADVLKQASGRQVRVGEQTVTLAFPNNSVRDYAPNWRTNFLAIITNPTIAYVLLLAGIYGLILEAFHPGALLPGIGGVICLLIGMYALQMLPVNYAGLALMAVGVGLLIAEMVSPTIGVIGVGGVISFVLGSILLFNTNVPGYAVNLGVIAGIAFAAIGVLAMILWLVMRSRRANEIESDLQMVGASGQLLQPTDERGEGWAQIYGERWQVLSDAPLPAGTSVRVVRRDGLLLWVIPD